MTDFKTLDDLNPTGQRVLVRLDLNLPMENGKVTDTTRLERSLPTLKELASKGAKTIVMAHLGRPQGVDKTLSLEPIAEALKEALTPLPVHFSENPQDIVPGEILLLENIRFNPGEEKNDPAFVREMASWGDVYVNDAFSAAHRAHASTEGIAHLLPSYAGRLMEEELKALHMTLDTPKRPLMAIVGGSKVSTKLPLLENLLSKVDILVIGGAMANTFLAAQGNDVGASLYEPDLIPTAKELLNKDREILLPLDVVVTNDLEDPQTRTCMIHEVKRYDKIFDIGPATVNHIYHKLQSSHTLLWNGPLGVFEKPPFDHGTNAVAQAAAHLSREGSIVSVAGGGDTVAALANAGVTQDFTYVSTAGGAFLEWLEGKPLPGVLALFQKR